MYFSDPINIKTEFKSTAVKICIVGFTGIKGFHPATEAVCMCSVKEIESATNSNIQTPISLKTGVKNL